MIPLSCGGVICAPSSQYTLYPLYSGGLEEKKTGKVHGLTLKERKYGKLTGVQDIHSFNENEILLQTEAGKVQIKGEQLHVKSLDLEKGEAEIEGKVNSVSYLTKNAQKKEEPLLKRMFR